MGALKVYLVGGAVRDLLMGQENKDLDYAIECGSFEEMEQWILLRGGEIFVSKPSFFTIRANIRGLGTADFVMCRKESGYRDSRHPDHVEPGTILDDLQRRDASVNAMAKDMSTDEIIDPHGGLQDLQAKILRAVGDPFERFNEDKLRILRFMRFAVTKGFVIEPNTARAMGTFTDLAGVSTERIREELLKMFGKDTSKSLQVLDQFPLIKHYVLTKTDIWLKPTTEQY